MKKKYSVYGIMSATVFLGEYEANSKEEALELADSDTNANWNPSLCWQCAGEVDLGDIYKTEASEVDDD